MDLVGRPAGAQAHERVDAAGVVADHPAQGVMRMGRGVGCEGEVVSLGLGAEDVEHRARLDPRQFRRGVDREDLVYRLGPVDDDRDVATTAGQARTAAPREDRVAVTATDGDRLNYVADVLRDHDADRHLAVVRPVGDVEGATAGIEADLAADRLAQRGRERRGVNEEGPDYLLAVSLDRCGSGRDRHRHGPFVTESSMLRTIPSSCRGTTSRRSCRNAARHAPVPRPCATLA